MNDSSHAANQQRGCFIVFEGGEGAGKSTQARLLATAIDAVLTREPGGTALGKQLRALLLGSTSEAAEDSTLDAADDTTDDTNEETASGGDVELVAIKAEALLMAADRAHHVATHVRPLLESGRHVVSDRYIGSSVAYQGFGRGLDPTELFDLSVWATDGLLPDVVFFVDVPSDLAWERIGGARDRIEAAGQSFHDAVRDGFLQQAHDNSNTWVIIDGTRPIELIAAEVLAVVAERFGLDVPRQGDPS